MSNHFPTIPDGLYVAGLTYLVEVASVGGIKLGYTSPPNPNFFPYSFCSVSFNTTTDSSGNTVPDYSSFDQDSFEIYLSSLLDAICAFGVSAYTLTTEQVQSAIKVYRQWTLTNLVSFDSSYTAIGQGDSITIQDEMMYPS